MFLISGKYKGRKLKSPKGLQTRPTTSLLRKALFDICKGYIEEAAFLDLFAGTGAIGLEALSRGAAHVTFIEQNREALHCLSENATLLNCQDQIKILRGNALLLLKKLKGAYDILYIDPPYQKVSLSEILFFLDKSALINKEGHVFIETALPLEEDITKLPLNRLKLIDSRRFGKSGLFHFFFS